MSGSKPRKLAWSAQDVPDLKGKTAIVTGANSGVGFEIARELALHGAHVVLASRDWQRTEEARRRIEQAPNQVKVETITIDLGSLESVRAFAQAFLARHNSLDILINNAGISGGPRRESKDGYELIFQVNYLGHFALAGLLLPALQAAPAPRVVTISSDIAASGRIDFNDLQSTRRFGLVSTYAQSKLAALIFAIELDRRFRAADLPFRSYAANPGVAHSELFKGKVNEWGRSLTVGERMLQTVQRVLGHPAPQGALPALFQATAPAAQSSCYVVGTKWPQRPGPVISPFPARALDPGTARRLWDVTVELTGVCYEGLTEPAAKTAPPKV